jgi:hypothetical protein
MKLTYQLDHNDFLKHQLYSASKSARIKKKRRNSWLIASATMLLLGFLFYQSNNSFLSYCCLAFGVFTFIFFPLYQRQQYKDHYAKFIADAYKNRFGLISTIYFNEDTIETSDSTGESKINLSELAYVAETRDYFYPGLKTGEHIIIPKSKITDLPQLRQDLRKLCDRLKIDFIEDLNWKWK